MRNPTHKLAHRVLLTIFTSLFATASWAQPTVTVTVAPVHSWVSMVAGTVFEPELLLPANTDPHNASLKPSQLRNIQRSDWVIWVGPQLEVGMADLIERLPESRVWQLTSEHEDLIHHEFRDAGVIYSVGTSSDEHDDHGHSDQDNHEAGEHHEGDGAHGDSHEDEHGRTEDGHGDSHEAAAPTSHAGHGHAAQTVDPHLWLDPENARRSIQVIADRLAELDPEHAAAYRANASDALTRLGAAEARWRNRLDGQTQPYAVFHDGYQYFDRAFEIPFAGSVTLDPERLPGLQTVARLRDGLAEASVGCLFAEVQYSDRLVGAVNERMNLPIRRLDAIGLDISTGPDHYFTVMDRLVEAFASCQSEHSG